MQTRRLTGRERAAIMNVSESGVYLARELIATGREDLCDRIMAGRLWLLGALKLALPKYGATRDCYDDLVKAWNACSKEERQQFIAALKEAGEREASAREA